SMLCIRDLALESDFLMLNLDALQQYLLAADRDNAEQSAAFDTLHPVVLRALAKACEVAEGQKRPLAAFGISAARPENLALLVGSGPRQFGVPPAALREFLSALSAVDARGAARQARTAARSASPAETRSRVVGYRHGYARP